jgi:hypothetical protein
MNIISFDVGIKNMAYCIFSIDVSISILDWNVLNLMEEMPIEKHPCTCTIPPKTKKAEPKPCNKNAKYKKNGRFYCEKHAKSGSPFIIPNKQNNPTFLKKLKVADLFRLCQSHLLFLNIENPEKLLKKDLLEKLIAFYEKQCFEPIIVKKAKTAGETDLIDIGRKMNASLDNVSLINNINCVIIENQISPIANRMKTIQGMLAQYFIMKVPSAGIEFVSSANKLKQFTACSRNQEEKLENVITPTNELPTNETATSYKKNKSDGVKYCSQILDKIPQFQQWKPSLETKKKDDLADCFLQGIWYINKNKLSII